MNMYDTTQIVHRAGCPSATQPEYKVVCIWCEEDARKENEKTHIRGRWQIRNGEHGSKIIYCMNDKYSYTPIAETLPLNDSLAPHKANALLIAAAPELLEACKGLLSEVGRTDYPKHSGMTLVWLDKAKAAIQKAEGGER